MQDHRPKARERLLAEVSGRDEAIDLARAALWIAAEEYPQLAPASYLARLDQLAEEARGRLNEESAPLVVLQEVLGTLFQRYRFRGNREAYYDPRNSFLNDVLDRRLGIPLSLGIVLLEVGWRLGLPLEGVRFPGHFLVRFRGEAVSFLVDPFEGGVLRFADEAQELLDRVYGGMVRVHESFLRRASRREMLIRMLTNLKSVYWKRGDLERALAAVERILLIRPISPAEVRDRGVLLAEMGRREEAKAQLEAYLAVAPEAQDAGRVRGLLEELSQRRGEEGGGA